MDDGTAACPTLRIAAAGDVHAGSDRADELRAALRALEEEDPVDLLLLAGDLTTHGEPEQARQVVEALSGFGAPVLAVLGNHDWHADRVDELVPVLEDGGVQVLDGAAAVVRCGAREVGVVGVKGLIGGFPGCHLPDFGEPSLRRVYREGQADVEALAAGLAEVATSPTRIALLHYAPTEETLVGEPEGIWPFLGTDRLAAPIREHEPDLVLHGHAHRGTPEGRIGTVPVHNVALPLLGGRFKVFDLEVRTASGVH